MECEDQENVTPDERSGKVVKRRKRAFFADDSDNDDDTTSVRYSSLCVVEWLSIRRSLSLKCN